MSKEQIGELGTALEILSAKSSVLEERRDLAQLIEETKEAEDVSRSISLLEAADEINISGRLGGAGGLDISLTRQARPVHAYTN